MFVLTACVPGLLGRFKFLCRPVKTCQVKGYVFIKLINIYKRGQSPLDRNLHRLHFFTFSCLIFVLNLYFAQKLPRKAKNCSMLLSVQKVNGGAPRARSGRSGAQWVRKFGNLPFREVLVITFLRPYARPTVRPHHRHSNVK